MSTIRCASIAASHRFEQGGRVELHPDPLAPERLVELGERPRERTFAVTAGKRDQGAGGGGEGDTLGRGEAPWPGECGPGTAPIPRCRSR